MDNFKIMMIIMKVLVIGAGAQGGPCASILARDKDVSEIVLGDIDLESARKVSKKIGSDKITVRKLDAGNTEEVARTAKGMDVIINLTLTAYNMNIMEAALKSGSHYVDTSFGEPSLMDIRARDNILAQIIEKRPLSFNKEYKKAGLTALLGCGGSPGRLNVIAKHICDKLDRVDEIHIIEVEKSIEKPKDVVHAWTPSWSPFRALWGYAVEPTIFEDGEYKKYPIFARPEKYRLPDPFGSVLLSLHQHQEPITLPHFIGKGIKYCDFKYNVDVLAGAFVKMGFASTDTIDVKGVKVIPRDVLLKMVRAPVNAFLAENERSAKEPLNEIALDVVEVKGTQSGEEVKYTVTTPMWFYRTVEERLSVFKKLGTWHIEVAVPAVVGAKMCVKGDADRGVICAECLDPAIFFGLIADMGVPLNLHEVVERDLSFSRARAD